MYYYIELTCLPDLDAEISTGFLMSRVMGVIHLHFANRCNKTGACRVGLGFPEYSEEVPHIGAKIRLFSMQKEDLEDLNVSSLLRNFSDYLHIKSISHIAKPNLKFCTYKRVQLKSSKERLIRRRVKRSGLDEATVREQYGDFTEQSQSELPFVNMKSLSTGKQFKLFIQKNSAERSENWSFSSYGLSGCTSVPDF